MSASNDGNHVKKTDEPCKITPINNMISGG